MTITPNLTADMVRDRGTKLAVQLRACGQPVVGVDAVDDTAMIGLVFKLANGRLAGFRLAYDDASYDGYLDLLRAVEARVA